MTYPMKNEVCLKTMLRNSLRPTILSTYVFRHFFPAFLTAAGFFTFIILIFYLKETIRHGVEKGVDVFLILQLCWYALGWTFTLTIPMAALLSSLISIGGLNADSEIIAMRAGGITYPRIFRPLFVFGIVLTICMSWFSQFIVPGYFGEMSRITRAILQSDPIAIIEPGQFTTLDKKGDIIRKIYVGSIPKGADAKGKSLLKNIQIRKIETVRGTRRVSEFIIAKEGEKILKKNSDGRTMRSLRLYEGYVFNLDKNTEAFQRIDFHKGVLDISIIEPDMVPYERPPGEFASLTFFEINREILRLENSTEKDRDLYVRKAKLERNKRFALAFSNLLFLYLGFPLAIVNRRSGKGMGLGLSIIYIFGYFVFFLSADTIAGEKNILPPALAAWLGNIALFLSATYVFLKRTIEFTWSDIPRLLRDLFSKKIIR